MTKSTSKSLSANVEKKVERVDARIKASKVLEKAVDYSETGDRNLFAAVSSTMASGIMRASTGIYKHPKSDYLLQHMVKRVPYVDKCTLGCIVDLLPAMAEGFASTASSAIDYLERANLTHALSAMSWVKCDILPSDDDAKIVNRTEAGFRSKLDEILHVLGTALFRYETLIRIANASLTAKSNDGMDYSADLVEICSLRDKAVQTHSCSPMFCVDGATHLLKTCVDLNNLTYQLGLTAQCLLNKDDMPRTEVFGALSIVGAECPDDADALYEDVTGVLDSCGPTVAALLSVIGAIALGREIMHRLVVDLQYLSVCGSDE